MQWRESISIILEITVDQNIENSLKNHKDLNFFSG